jgi:hypothetical protein
MRTIERASSVEGLDYHGECRSARLVASGFYDFTPQSPSTLLLSLAAAYGNDIPAAVIMSGLQASLAALSRNRPKELSIVMRELNRMACNLPLVDFHVAMFCAEIDTSKRMLNYVNAGHTAPLLIRHGSSRVLRLSNSGTVLGLTTKTAFEHRTMPFDPDDILVAVSDIGPFREQAMIETVREHPWDSSGELTRRLMRVIDPASSADQTVVVVRAVEVAENVIDGHAMDELPLAYAV